MKENTKILLEEYESHFLSNKRFIESNDWVNAYSSNTLFETEKELVKNMLTSFSSFVEDIGTDRYLKPVIKFTDMFMGIVDTHISRIDKYLDESDELSTITQDIENLNRLIEEEPNDVGVLQSDVVTLNKKRQREIKFRNNIFTSKVSIKNSLSKLNLLSDNIDGASPHLFEANNKGSLLMRPILTNEVEYVKNRTEALGIDFNAAHLNPATSNEMLINMNPKDIPPYDSSRHFFEQEKSTIQFWEEELIKCKEGINVGGYWLHPFLYWHLNIYKFNIGSGQNKRVGHPHFWDNDYYFAEMLKEAEHRGDRGIFSYGSRRTSKTTKLSSFTDWKLHTIPYAEGSLVGFSEEDLNQILKYSRANKAAMHPAFKVTQLSSSIGNGIKMGVKKLNGVEEHRFAYCDVLKLGGNTKKEKLKTAGGTPDFIAFDEAAKGGILLPWNTARASFSAADSDKWRTVPLLSATAGVEDLSADAEKILQNPEEYQILAMNWDLYDEHIPEEHRTWENETFGLFIPCQMSLEAPQKIKTNLGQFLGKDDTELSKIDFYVTDWKNATPYFKKRQKDLEKVPEALASEQKNFPLSISDCLVSTSFNRYPSLVAKRHKKYIKDNNLTGRKVWLDMTPNGEIVAETTNDPIISQYPFKGGNFSAPVVLLDEIEEGVTPKFGLYVIGLDDIKHNKTSGDSVYSVTMYKRKYDGGKWADRFCAYYHTREFSKDDAYRQTYLLMKKYNAIVFPENDDEGFVEYVERYHPEDLRHFASGVDFAELNNMFRNSNRKYGFSTNAGNIEYIDRKLEHYTKRRDLIINGKQGLLGVQAIYDPMLLEEFIRYKKGNNADRIRSAALAYAYGDFLDKYNIHVYLDNQDPYQRQKNKKEEKEIDIDMFSDMDDMEVF